MTCLANAHKEPSSGLKPYGNDWKKYVDQCFSMLSTIHKGNNQDKICTPDIPTDDWYNAIKDANDKQIEKHWVGIGMINVIAPVEKIMYPAFNYGIRKGRPIEGWDKIFRLENSKRTKRIQNMIQITDMRENKTDDKFEKQLLQDRNEFMNFWLILLIESQ